MIVKRFVERQIRFNVDSSEAQKVRIYLQSPLLRRGSCVRIATESLINQAVTLFVAAFFMYFTLLKQKARDLARDLSNSVRKVIDYTENPDAFDLYDGF